MIKTINFFVGFKYLKEAGQQEPTAVEL